MQHRVGIAAGNVIGAGAAAHVAREGGNAVDACLAAAVMAWVAEPFFASIGGSGFIAIRSPDGAVEVIDGNNAMPVTRPRERGQATERVYLDYSDGMYTRIGAGSVAVPGILSAVALAWERHGRIEWEALFEQPIEAARKGISFPRTSAYYLSCTGDSIWSVYPESRSLFFRDGVALQEGENLVQGELAEALEMIAREGPETFYEGALGRAIADGLQERGGFMRIEDLASYEAEIRRPLQTVAFGWKVDTNPPPALGGALLVHMLALLAEQDLSGQRARLRAVVESQRLAFGYRGERYEDPLGIAAAFDEALSGMASGSRSRSADTTHSSTADADGYLCSVTESSGYGSGVVLQGIVLNNTLGEEELNPLGIHSLAAGARCHSSMAPTIAAGPERIVALGSPGADRIAPAIAQAFLRLALDHMTLADAVSAPRAYIEARDAGETLCFEPGLAGAALPYVPRPYDEIHMYFGAVQAASVDADGRVDAAHDPRRSGGTAIV